ncbi:uncharacterized protein LOC133867983 isoform X2 [Alnus glutinosa]|uniref:uncharacterized protein LOC133867983 isoform X2 n=1 Tax=Alnus glutinosa TaxID=3517 RepID=UPI002D79B6F9|nr:uncharacterized protein LOC133867983 isoform X2 [Alnus glutinosa]
MCEKRDTEVDTGKKANSAVKKVAIDKELLQVEDMRLIIHNLGKFSSHRDVKITPLEHSTLKILLQNLITHITQSCVTSKATHQDSILEILLQHPLTHITQSCVESKATHQNKYCSNQQVHTCHTHSQKIAVARTQWQCRTYKERLTDIFLIYEQ